MEKTPVKIEFQLKYKNMSLISDSQYLWNFSLVWQNGEVPQQYNDTLIIHLYKLKGTGVNVTAIEEYPFFRLLAESLHVSV